MKTILFVDDDALVSRIYRDKLSEEGFNVVVAADGVAAMKRLVEASPDVVVLDLLMPKMNGADVLKFIRERPELKAARVIVFSNSFLAALVEQVGSLGVEGVLPKSTATPAKLIELIYELLAQAEAGTPPQMSAAGQGKGQRAEPASVPSLRLIKEAPQPGKESKDEQFRSRVQKEFVSHLPRVLEEIRKYSHGLMEAAEAKVELQMVENLSRKVGFLTQMASMARCAELAQLASALELLFFHLQEKKAPVADSARNTIAGAVAFLSQHLERFDPTRMENGPPAMVLVVDDDMVSNRGIVHALTHANLTATSVTDPLEALEKLKRTPYALVLLDVEMPQMTGIALCEQIRTLELHRRTPVIFLTGHTDLKTRARSILSGGNDFISKPILPIELTVKVITQLLQSRS